MYQMFRTSHTVTQVLYVSDVLGESHSDLVLYQTFRTSHKVTLKLYVSDVQDESHGHIL